MNFDQLKGLAEKDLLLKLFEEIGQIKSAQAELAQTVDHLKVPDPKSPEAAKTTNESTCDTNGTSAESVSETETSEGRPAEQQEHRPTGSTRSRDTGKDQLSDPHRVPPGPDHVYTDTGDCSPSEPDYYRPNGAAAEWDLEEEYQALCHHLNRLRPVPGEVLRDNHKGFKREFQTTARLISRCARRTENLLKILNLCARSEEIVDLTLIAKSQLQLLKTEYSCLIVANDAENPKVAANYRRIKQGCTGMSKTDLEDYKLAVDISSQDSRGEFKKNFKGRKPTKTDNYSPYKSFVKNRDSQPPRPSTQTSDN